LVSDHIKDLFSFLQPEELWNNSMGISATFHHLIGPGTEMLQPRNVAELSLHKDGAVLVLWLQSFYQRLSEICILCEDK
jgi:hypothetical protein